MDRHDAAAARGKQAVVRVRALSSSGAGVADLPEGLVAFVHRTAPGDEARVRVTRRHRRWAQARLEEVLQPAPTRVDPPCPLYDRCGGCTMQHMAYDEQLRWKGRFVADALQRIGHLDVEEPDVRASQHAFHYRNRLTFTLRRLRAGRVVAGFHALDEPAWVVDVHGECLLPEEPVGQAWQALRAAWGPEARHLPSGGNLRLTLRSGTGGVSLLVDGGSRGWEATELASLDALTDIWHRPEDAERPYRVVGTPMKELWGGEILPVAGGVFLQVNREAAEVLREYVLDEVGSEGGEAVDAYCGVGFYGRDLARRGWRVTGIEMDAGACATARHDAPPGLDIVEGPVERHLSEALPADLVLLNPPRTGLDALIPPLLVERPVRRIVYVSCDPATLARDAARLSAGYDLSAIHAFDLFPQTPHVETVARFDRTI